MKKVLIIGGTSEGRKLAEMLVQKGIAVCIAVAGEMGASFIKEGPLCRLNVGRLTQDGFYELMRREKADAVMDVSHPFAAEVSANVMNACKKAAVLYLRLERKTDVYPGSIIRVKDYEEAVKTAEELAGNVLITTGTKYIEKFTKLTAFPKGVSARILNTAQAVDKCILLGFLKENIFPGYGAPNKEEIRRILMRQDVKVLVAKDSGKEGGTHEKALAALECGTKLILINRPEVAYENKFSNMEEMVAFFEEKAFIQG